MKKLIYLNHEPLTENTKNLWMVDELTENGVDVRYWDISNILKKDIKYPNTISDSRLIVVKTFTQLNRLLRSEDKKEVFFVDEFPYLWRNLWLRFYLKFMSCRLIRINVFYYASNDDCQERKHRFYKKIYKIPAWSLLKVTKLFKLQDYEVVFSPFEQGPRRSIKTNLPVYETYKRNIKYIKNDDVIVFIDEYLPLHPDLKILYNYQYSQSEVCNYRDALNTLFDNLEKRFKKKVVIAAHPKSNYDGSEFNGREIIYGRTCQLLLSSSIVISHSSLADSYPILSNKPMIFVYTNLFKSITNDGCLFTNILRRASMLGIKAYNIDEDNLDKIEPQFISEDNRNKFIYSFLTSKESEDCFNADIISSYLRTS